VKTYRWGEAKNRLLRAERGIGFEDVVTAIAAGQLLDVLKHRNPAKYPHQSVFVVELKRYVCLVPFVEDAESYFLKTIIPSRKATRDYLTKRDP
jgi:uncharacterized DUF497 family protein